MLQLYFAAFGAVAAANIIAVIAIAATIKRVRSRFWPLWLWPQVLKGHPDKMASKRPRLGGPQWRVWGLTSLFCVRGLP
jgi:hypothetical protein